MSVFRFIALICFLVGSGCSVLPARKIRCSVEHGGFLASTQEYNARSCFERAKVTCKREPKLAREGKHKEGKYMVYSCD